MIAKRSLITCILYVPGQGLVLMDFVALFSLYFGRKKTYFWTVNLPYTETGNLFIK